MNKKDLSERDICSKFIGPAVKRAGWDGMLQIREEVAFTKGRIIVRCKLVSRVKATRTQVSSGDLLVVITGAGVTTPALLDKDLGEAYVSQHVGLIKSHRQATVSLASSLPNGTYGRARRISEESLWRRKTRSESRQHSFPANSTPTSRRTGAHCCQGG